MPLYLLAHRLLGLLHPEWTLRSGPRPGATHRARGAQGLVLREERRSGEIQGGAPVEEATRCAYDGARIREAQLVGVVQLSSFQGSELSAPRAGSGARVAASVFDRARIREPQLAELTWTGCNLRAIDVRSGTLGSLTLCDLLGARLVGVRVEALVACDLGGSVLQGCDLRGADLSGTSFRGAHLVHTQLEGARVAGADFTGARGLDAATREQLVRDGATVRGSALLPLVRRLSPGARPGVQQRLAAVLAVALPLGALLLGLGAAARTLVPPPADQPEPIAPTRGVSAEDRQATQRALLQLREALDNAHARLQKSGATQHIWPTLVELQANRYDADGEGSAELWETLVHGGLPDNRLTSSRGGALAYCEDNPRQEALRGVDVDWYYCELTGRIFASAGFTEEATLNW